MCVCVCLSAGYYHTYHVVKLHIRPSLVHKDCVGCESSSYGVMADESDRTETQPLNTTICSSSLSGSESRCYSNAKCPNSVI